MLKDYWWYVVVECFVKKFKYLEIMYFIFLKLCVNVVKLFILLWVCRVGEGEVIIKFKDWFDVFVIFEWKFVICYSVIS